MLPAMLGEPRGFPAGADAFNHQNQCYAYSVNCVILVGLPAHKFDAENYP